MDVYFCYCRDRVTCYPEGVIWNNTLDKWGAAYWATMLRNSQDTTAPNIPAAPTAEEIRVASKESQAKRKGLIPRKRKAVGHPEESNQGQRSNQFFDTALSGIDNPNILHTEDSSSETDEDEFSGAQESYFLGSSKNVGRHLSITRKNEIAAAVGFWMVKHSSYNTQFRWPKKLTGSYPLCNTAWETWTQ